MLNEWIFFLYSFFLGGEDEDEEEEDEELDLGGGKQEKAVDDGQKAPPSIDPLPTLIMSPTKPATERPEVSVSEIVSEDVSGFP